MITTRAPDGANKWLTKQKIDVVFTQTIVTYKMANHCFVSSFVSMANDDMGGNKYKTRALGLKPFCCQLSHVCRPIGKMMK